MSNKKNTADAAQKRKVQVLIALTVVMVGVALKTFVFNGSSKPSSASAAPPQAKVPAPSDPKGDDASTPLQEMVTIEVVGISSPPRDLFDFDTSAYTSVAAPPVPDVPSGTKPVPVAVPTVSERVQEAAASLKKQGTILGDTPRVLINDRVLGVGDAIDGFVVREISSRRVVVEKDGVRVELKG